MAHVSGHGATLVFTDTPAFLPSYTSHGGFEASRPSLDTSSLSTNGSRTKIGGDLYDVGPMSSSYLVDPLLMITSEAESLLDFLFAGADVSPSDTVTLDTQVSSGVNFAADGHVTGFALEELSTDLVLAASITWQWDVFPTIAE